MRIKINFATEYFKETNDEKYLILHSTKEYESVWSEIRSEIKRTNGGEKIFYQKNYYKIGISTERKRYQELIQYKRDALKNK